MNTDMVVGISDRATDALNLLFNSDVGKSYLARRRRLEPALLAQLDGLGLSSIANVLAAIKTAQRLDLGADEAIVTVATDGAAMYGSEREKFGASRYPDGFDEVNAGEVFGEHLAGLADDHTIELDTEGRKRVFNLGYYTWVEQQGVPLADFDRRRDQRFWRGLQGAIPVWDRMIEDFNARTGLNRPG
jgi:hypothetical protein